MLIVWTKNQNIDFGIPKDQHIDLLVPNNQNVVLRGASKKTKY